MRILTKTLPVLPAQQACEFLGTHKHASCMPLPLPWALFLTFCYHDYTAHIGDALDSRNAHPICEQFNGLWILPFISYLSHHHIDHHIINLRLDVAAH